ncbi:MAG: hypothetical protein IJW46_07855 [Clostridia bacterium]|nr:hypothetical protein [Clostridia bacterium]
MDHTHGIKNKTLPVLWGAVLLFFVLLLVMRTEISRAAYDALVFSAKKLIPALFPFALLAKLTAALPYPQKVRHLPMGLSLSALPACLLGLLAGYPMGALAAKGLYDSGTVGKKEALRLTACTNNASLAFLLMTVAPLFGGQSIGWVLFFSASSASLIALVLTNDRSPKSVSLPLPRTQEPFVSLLTRAIAEAAEAMLTLTAFVTFFAIVSRLCFLIPPLVGLSPYLMLFLEPTAAVRTLAVSSLSGKLPLAAFALGFSGLSVLMQDHAIWEGKLPLTKIAACRLLIGILSAIFSLFFQKIL